MKKIIKVIFFIVIIIILESCNVIDDINAFLDSNTTSTILEKDYNDLSFGVIAGENSTNNIISNDNYILVDKNMNLISHGEHGSSITWKSSATDYLTDDGVITKSVTNVLVNLTAVLSYKGNTRIKTFSFFIKAFELNNQVTQDNGEEYEFHLRYQGELYTIKFKTRELKVQNKIQVNDKDIYKNFLKISHTLTESENHDQECKKQLGDGFRLADWNDIKEYYNNGGSLSSFFSELGYKIGYGSRVSYNGQFTAGFASGKKRHYFFSYHNHNKPGNYLAHAQLNNYEISLGSWYGTGGTALCYNNAADEEVIQIKVVLNEKSYTNPLTIRKDYLQNYVKMMLYEYGSSDPFYESESFYLDKSDMNFYFKIPELKEKSVLNMDIPDYPELKEKPPVMPTF